MQAALDGLSHVGEGVRALVLGAGRLLRFVAGVMRHGLFPPWAPFMAACWALLASCLLPVVMVVVPMGALISLQGASIIQAFGVERLLAPLVAVTVVRELAPGFAAMMVAMQAGTALAAQVAVMRVREELEAYEMMAVDPLKHVVSPRLWAGAVVSPMLCVVAMAHAVLGAWVVAAGVRGFASRAFLDGCLSAISRWDLAAALIKASVFGVVISAVACFEGWHARRSAEGVGRATNRSVVGALLGILLFNWVLNSVLYAAPAVLQ